MQVAVDHRLPLFTHRTRRPGQTVTRQDDKVKSYVDGKEIQQLGASGSRLSPHQTFAGEQALDQAALADIAAAGKGNFRPIRCRTTFQGRSTGDKVCAMNMHQLNSRLLAYL